VVLELLLQVIQFEQLGLQLVLSFQLVEVLKLILLAGLEL
jgi:hypothetical protein